MNMHNEIKKLLIDENKNFKWLGAELNVDASNLSRQIKLENISYSRLATVLNLLGKQLSIEPKKQG